MAKGGGGGSARSAGGGSTTSTQTSKKPITSSNVEEDYFESLASGNKFMCMVDDFMAQFGHSFEAALKEKGVERVVSEVAEKMKELGVTPDIGIVTEVKVVKGGKGGTETVVVAKQQTVKPEAVKPKVTSAPTTKPIAPIINPVTPAITNPVTTKPVALASTTTTTTTTTKEAGNKYDLVTVKNEKIQAGFLLPKKERETGGAASASTTTTTVTSTVVLSGIKIYRVEIELIIS